MSLITINTDASWSRVTGWGSYAFWAVCNDFKIQKSGVFKTKCSNPDTAELKCIINALSCVAKKGKFSKIIVNTDSLNSIHIFENDLPKLVKYGLGHGKSFRKMFNKEFGHLKIEFRHVKAHKTPTDGRTYVNAWCDENAKLVLKDFLIEKGLWNFNL